MSDLNDPRVFFAAERTLLAWNRSSLALMAFGFVIERFGLFVTVLLPNRHDLPLQRGLSFWTGLAFVLLGAFSAGASTLQFRKVLKTLKPVEIPRGYWISPGIITNLAVAALGLALTVYFFAGI